jgi:putative transcriptional regulator
MAAPLTYRSFALLYVALQLTLAVALPPPGNALGPEAVVAPGPGTAHPAPGPAKGQFLIASRTLTDPNFSESVVLLLAYDPRGAMGIVINHPTDVPLASALPDVKELHERSDRVHRGGPVAINLMVVLIRSTKRPESSEQVFGDVYASGSLKALRKTLGKGTRTGKLRAYAGHAGWGPGQLDTEIARGDWLVTSADAATVFDTPSAEIWPKLMERLSGEWTRAPSAPSDVRSSAHPG